MKTKSKHLTTFEQHLDTEYGKQGTKKREAFEHGYESFKLGVVIRQAREEQKLSQSQLA